MKYRATLISEFEITAENIVEARRLASRIRAVGEVVASHRPLHNRDGIRAQVTRISQQVRVQGA